MLGNCRLISCGGDEWFFVPAVVEEGDHQERKGKNGIENHGREGNEWPEDEVVAFLSG